MITALVDVEAASPSWYQDVGHGSYPAVTVPSYENTMSTHTAPPEPAQGESMDTNSDSGGDDDDTVAGDDVHESIWDYSIPMPGCKTVKRNYPNPRLNSTHRIGSNCELDLSTSKTSSKPLCTNAYNFAALANNPSTPRA